MNENPLHEPSVRVLMSSMDASGNRAGALQAYEDYRASVETALGTKPAEPTQDLAAELRSTTHADLEVLTPREREVAALLAEGMTNRQISERLFISVLTTETHVKRILTKLGLSSRTQVAALLLSRQETESDET